jgi:mRNA-degrading endonuclease RelE of RelBE toxin-antitoxin system
MSHTLVWGSDARSALRRLRSLDPAAAKAVTAAARDLTVEPHPHGSHQLGGTSFYRLRLGGLRIMYEVDTATSTVYIHSVGQLPPKRRR